MDRCQSQSSAMPIYQRGQGRYPTFWATSSSKIENSTATKESLVAVKALKNENNDLQRTEDPQKLTQECAYISAARGKANCAYWDTSRHQLKDKAAKNPIYHHSHLLNPPSTVYAIHPSPHPPPPQSLLKPPLPPHPLQRLIKPPPRLQ